MATYIICELTGPVEGYIPYYFYALYIALDIPNLCADDSIADETDVTGDTGG